MKVVVIDDYRPTLEMIEAMLEHIENISIYPFEDADEAYAYILSQHVDVILMDICMPKTDGIEWCRRFKQHEQLQHVPVLMVTGYDEEQKLEEAFAAGAFDYIRKPFTMVELIARVQLAYRQKETMDQLKRTNEAYMESYRHMWAMQKKMNEDLHLARLVQEGLLPERMNNEHIHFVGTYIPSSQLSGDLYFWQQVRPHMYAFIVIDVMGHGVASALVAMSIRSLLHGLMTKVTEPLAVVHELNRHAFQLFGKETKYYFTAFYGTIDVKTKVIEYVNAGHPSGIFMTDQKMKFLKEGGIPIGIVPNAPYKKGTISFQHEAYLILYTDGLIEVLGEECANQLAHTMQMAHSFDQMVEKINEQAQYAKGNDDITFVSIHVK
ncbi:protein phosphatase [Anoxybacillus gonensis]|uniref:Fused response regulator/phosphatase n=1 Tax=Anoxybacillus gonensis TaxID=198467 RepID=A0AAW7TI97_9BACL|nr:fused response regulator/phosphatase [Anoxybacillus gonensis]AXM90282.1 fused response regulator/phosphatase [Anoxybacillus ayderensis G10]AKS38452.1 protein phosphatase [Anoxybacillus gonensis]KGP60382.1 protein phosphatase [Anoxybacillus gonensis]MCQ5365412.1 fused response regulator/phosphatase [Anoxybacillus gonensis]MCX8046776.1 fused response regulator/phosphatase [Anoxybacillus gonensis]